MSQAQTKGFGSKASQSKAPAAASSKSDAASAAKYEDHYADVTQMKRADGRVTKYVKFVKDISDSTTGLFIPKGTIFDFETFEDIYERTENPSEKMLNWLNQRQAPFVTSTGAELTGIGQIKKPFKKES